MHRSKTELQNDSGQSNLPTIKLNSVAAPAARAVSDVIAAAASRRASIPTPFRRAGSVLSLNANPEPVAEESARIVIKLARNRDEARRLLRGALRERRAATARVEMLEAALTIRASEVEDAQNLLREQATAYEAALSETRAETASLRAHAAAMQARVDSWARDVPKQYEAHQAVVFCLRACSHHLESRIDALASILPSRNGI